MHMPKVASARVHGLYGDPVKGMTLKQLESAALTQLQEACRQTHQISSDGRDQVLLAPVRRNGSRA